MIIPGGGASRDPLLSMEKPMRSKKRTELPKPDYKEYDEPSEDSFIHCHLCNDLKLGPCQEEGHCLKITHYSSFHSVEGIRTRLSIHGGRYIIEGNHTQV